MDDEIKRWTARRKAALVLEIIQGKSTVAEASRAFDLPPSEIESWIDDGKRGMENALRAKPLEVKEGESLEVRPHDWISLKHSADFSSRRSAFVVS